MESTQFVYPILEFISRNKRQNHSIQYFKFKVIDITVTDHANYKIKVQGNNIIMIIDERYSTLLQLHQKLMKETGILNKFPPKRLWGNLKLTHLKTRSKQIEDYLNSLGRNTKVVNSLYFQKYIQRKTESTKLKINLDSLEQFDLDE